MGFPIELISFQVGLCQVPSDLPGSNTVRGGKSTSSIQRSIPQSLLTSSRLEHLARRKQKHHNCLPSYQQFHQHQAIMQLIRREANWAWDMWPWIYGSLFWGFWTFKAQQVYSKNMYTLFNLFLSTMRLQVLLFLWWPDFDFWLSANVGNFWILQSNWQAAVLPLFAASATQAVGKDAPSLPFESGDLPVTDMCLPIKLTFPPVLP